MLRSSGVDHLDNHIEGTPEEPAKGAEGDDTSGADTTQRVERNLTMLGQDVAFQAKAKQG
jgi:hypothetical protein